MSEPTIQCPSCGKKFPLTASLAAPLIEAREREHRRAMADAAAASAAALQAERTRIAAEEAKKARAAAGAEVEGKVRELEGKARELADLQGVVKQQNAKLAEAQAAQAEAIAKQRQLDDLIREQKLTVEKQVNAQLEQTRAAAKREAEESLGGRVAEKEQQIASMARQIEDLKRKAEQGSQQTQGEAQELALEAMLRAKFPTDAIEPVAKGEFGGDALQRVTGPGGIPAGTILWESKRTKAWQHNWLAKLKHDQHAAKAELAVIVTQTMPTGVETFECIDDIWVTSWRTALPMATVLRQSLIDLASARKAGEGQATKAEMLYQYLNGPLFRQRLQAIGTAFDQMQKELNAEKKAIKAQWAKREMQIERAVEAAVGMYGDVQGIAGSTLPVIEGLEVGLLGMEG
jgi:hypothetical protein